MRFAIKEDTVCKISSTADAPKIHNPSANGTPWNFSYLTKQSSCSKQALRKKKLRYINTFLTGGWFVLSQPLQRLNKFKGCNYHIYQIWKPPHLTHRATLARCHLKVRQPKCEEAYYATALQLEQSIWVHI